MLVKLNGFQNREYALKVIPRDKFLQSEVDLQTAHPDHPNIVKVWSNFWFYFGNLVYYFIETSTASFRGGLVTNSLVKCQRKNAIGLIVDIV